MSKTFPAIAAQGKAQEAIITALRTTRESLIPGEYFQAGPEFPRIHLRSRRGIHPARHGESSNTDEHGQNPATLHRSPAALAHDPGRAAQVRVALAIRQGRTPRERHYGPP